MLPLYNLNQQQKRIVLLSSLGGMLEFYDFTVYGIFATYFSEQFFPTNNPLMSLIASYAVFVIGYIARPIGGLIFSYIGDVVGRKIVLIITMVLMGIASFGLGLLPTYAQIGIFAPILMLFFRLLQGLAIGGELPSMIVYVSESMNYRRGFGLGGVFSGTFSGLLPGMLINLIMLHVLTHQQVYAFGWRIPFILGGLLCVVAYFIRRELHESSAFKKSHHNHSNPLVQLIGDYKIRLILSIIVVALIAAPTTLAILFMPTFMTKIAQINEEFTSDVVLVATLISVLSMWLSGYILQKVNLLRWLKTLLWALVISSGLAYLSLMFKNQFFILITLSLFAMVQGGLVVLGAVLLSYIFPIEVRLSGVALSYNISFILFGGLLPVYITAFIMYTGLIYLTPFILLLLIVSICSLVSSRISQFLPASAKIEH